MNSGNLTEIVIVNSIGIVLMIFLRLTRIETSENHTYENRLFNIMVWITMAGCAAELLTFLIDGKIFPGCRFCSYLLNSLCFIGTCTIGFLWCIFVEFRIFGSRQRLKKRIKFLSLPWIFDILLNLVNLGGSGILFSISRDNIYQRGPLAVAAYVILFFYFIYSLYLMKCSGKNCLRLRFFPVYYFVFPCMLGTVIQGMMYGITLGWTSVAIAFIFVHIETQSFNTFVDSLSGLYNRRYMYHILNQFMKKSPSSSIWGIMIDVNNFKHINDVYGHAKGDDAIRHIGMILLDSIPDNGIAVRYAGDEFVLLLPAQKKEEAEKIMDSVTQNLDAFNDSKEEPYTLSLAMGCSKMNDSGDIEQFLSSMDTKMYDAKKQHYMQTGTDRRKK